MAGSALDTGSCLFSGTCLYIMDKQELWRMHVWHGYCRGRTLHIAWNCWCNLHIYVCTYIDCTYFSTHIFDLDIRHPITSETHWPCRLIWVLVLRWKCSLHYTFSKNNLHTNLINNTVTMYKLVSLNWNSLEHYNLVTTTKNRQSARVQHFIDTDIYTIFK